MYNRLPVLLGLFAISAMNIIFFVKDYSLFNEVAGLILAIVSVR